MSQTFGSFIHGVVEPDRRGAHCFWFVFREERLLVSRAETEVEVPFLEDIASLGLPPLRRQFLGHAGGHPCMAAEVAASALPPRGWAFESLRPLFSVAPEDLCRLAGRAVQVLEWDRTHVFCGSCGAPTRQKEGDRAKECTACGTLSYPRISPAIIVAVVRDARILLARAHRFPPDLFSVLAGFVEPGETLEECVAREVREETGIVTREIRYFASQPWPFPHSLMVAFTAEYSSGEIEVEQAEIAEAGWFTADALPRIPDTHTIARRLIDWFCARR